MPFFFWKLFDFLFILITGFTLLNMVNRIFVMGDIHGNVYAFRQCLKLCDFRPGKDTLIQLGDVSDRYPDTATLVEELLKIPDLIAIRGNHDLWTSKWLVSGIEDPAWLNNGGKATLESYLNNPKIDIQQHRNFFEKRQRNYYVDDRRRIFVHGGFTHPGGPSFDPIETQCLLDRSLWWDALAGKKTNKRPHTLSQFEEIYIGHSPTQQWLQDKPMTAFNVWNLDTGAGHQGKLTIMDIETKEYWQSDRVDSFY